MSNQSLSRRHKLIYLFVAFALVFSTVGYTGIMALKEVLTEPDQPDIIDLPTRLEANDTINAGFEFRKVTERSDIPDDIWEAIGELELNRGSAGFTRMDYAGDTTWMLLCGGEDYANGYDVEITDIRYGIVGWLNEIGEQNTTPIADTDRVYSGVFLPYINEIATDEIMEYAVEAAFPYVLFEITSSVLEYDYINGQIIMASGISEDNLLSLQYTD